MSDPIEAIEQMMEREGLTRRDLLDVFGSRARACEVMGRYRRLSVDMIRRLHNRYGMDANVLIADYPMRTGERAARPHGNTK